MISPDFTVHTYEDTDNHPTTNWQSKQGSYTTQHKILNPIFFLKNLLLHFRETFVLYLKQMCFYYSCWIQENNKQLFALLYFNTKYIFCKNSFLNNLNLQFFQYVFSFFGGGGVEIFYETSYSFHKRPFSHIVITYF